MAQVSINDNIMELADGKPVLGPSKTLRGVLAAVLVSVMLALVHGFACITHRGNQVVSGLAMESSAAGVVRVLGRRCPLPQDSWRV